MRTHRAFTIVELLIAVAVIAIAVAVALPALSRVRKASATANCLANIRSLELANYSYMNDHEGRFIDAGMPHNNLPIEPAAWINTLKEYYVRDDVIRSPVDASPHWAEGAGCGVPVPGTTNRYRRTSYGLNNFLTQYSEVEALEGPGLRPDRVSKVRDPGSTVHLLIMVYTDTFQMCGSDHVHVEKWTQGPAAANPAQAAAKETQINAHGGPAGSAAARSNYGFLDGHAETLLFSHVFIDKHVHNRFDPEVACFWNARMADSERHR